MPQLENRTVITTERLILRTWSPADAEEVFAFWGEPEVMKYVEGGPAKDVESVRRGLAIGNAAYLEHGASLWAVVEKSTNRLVGACGFHQAEKPDSLELAYHFHSEVWGRGYATEAASACVEWALKSHGAGMVIAYTHPENQASERVLVKVGMSFLGMDNGEKLFVLK